MSYRKSVALQLFLLLGSLAYSAILASQLPDQVPIHWGLHGQPDSYGSKWFNLLIGPGLIVFNLTLTFVLPIFSRRQFSTAALMSLFGKVMLVTSALMATMGVVILKATTDPSFEVGKAMLTVMFGFLAAFGSVMRDLPRNSFIGIRTKWTMSSDTVWQKTHQATAKIWMVGGVLGVVLALLGVPMLVNLVLILVLSFLPVWNSYAQSRR